MIGVDIDARDHSIPHMRNTVIAHMADVRNRMRSAKKGPAFQESAGKCRHYGLTDISITGVCSETGLDFRRKGRIGGVTGGRLPVPIF